MSKSTKMGCAKNVKLTEDDFGFYLDKTSGKSIPVRRFTWQNQNGIEVQAITYGATITCVKVPDKDGNVADVALGFDDMEGYLNPLNPYFGATVGRVANRIASGKFQIDNQPYTVSTNRGTFTLHGGYKGFDKVVWEYSIEDKAVIFSYLSKDGEEGFPGDLIVNIKYELTVDNEFKMDMKAYTTKPTFVNMTNHSYFNMAGHNKDEKEMYNHTIQINASRYTAVDADSIPTGELVPVAETIFDLQTPKLIGVVINKVPGGGYDNNFCINTGLKNDVIFVARATHVPSGRSLEIYSNQPGLQFYTSNFIPMRNDNDPKSVKLMGKNNSTYYRQGSFALETQNYPDAVNHSNFPNAVLRPGQCYSNITHFVFPVKKKSF